MNPDDLRTREEVLEDEVTMLRGAVEGWRKLVAGIYSGAERIDLGDHNECRRFVGATERTTSEALGGRDTA